MFFLVFLHLASSLIELDEVLLCEEEEYDLLSSVVTSLQQTLTSFPLISALFLSYLLSFM